MDIGRKAVGEAVKRRLALADLEFAKREVPAQMAVKIPIPRIGGEPRPQKIASGPRLAVLVAEMRLGVRAVRVARVLRQRPRDLRARGVALPDLDERQPVMAGKPPVVAVMRGKGVHQRDLLALLPNAAGAA